jgi:hypothetical protein
MANDTRLSRQWSTRPADQRFLTMRDLLAHAERRHAASREVNVSDITLAINEQGTDLLAATPRGSAALTHWSFGQLCRLAGAPSEYVRSLPPTLAAPAVAWSLEQRARERGPVKALLHWTGAAGAGTAAKPVIEARAFTSPSYGRVWDADVARALLTLESAGWHVPAASYSGTDPLRATTLYASDRDIFCFLCRSEQIDVGNGQSINRGVMAWNSETGSATLGIATFTYDRVCDNRIIWDVKGKTEIRIRHTSGAPTRMVREVMPALQAYASQGTREIQATIDSARKCIVGTDRASVEEWMTKRGFTRAQASQAYAYAEKDVRNQHLNPRSVYGLVQGVTDYAHAVAHTDARTKLERQAGELLEAF